MRKWLFYAVFSVLATTIVSGAVQSAVWDVKSDTWTATDALGRELPGYEQCGPPRQGKYVGIFYFIWLGQHGVGGPYDITRILAANPDAPQWGPPGAFHHWGESELGYYVSQDEYVMRAHCRMLVDAGIDTLIFDVTNGYTYTPVYMALCRVYDSIRKEGGRTPQICFLTNTDSDKVVQKLYDEFYSKNLHSDLWFRWKGKPLMLAKPDTLPQNIKDFFTFRQSWAWHDPNGWFGDGKDKWPWLDTYPQAYGWHVEGVPEEVAVVVAQHPTTNIGRSFHNGKQPEPEDFRTDEGLCFAEQWKRALEVDPEFVFITGWNEWVAQRFLDKGTGRGRLCGKQLAEGDTFFVDCYSQEYSRDIEPMKGGHTDNYYYQMIANIRKFKGVRKPEAASPPKTISIDGSFSDWSDVSPEFRDHIGDTEHRNSKGWGNAGLYVNTTGRNDFVTTRVAYDQEYVYFYVETKDKITNHKDPNWMMLFIDSDCNSKTGWQGYDLLVNRRVIDDSTTVLSRSTTGWDWKDVCRVPFKVNWNKMELQIPRSYFAGAGKNLKFDFHWADNIQKFDDIIEFSISGDSAPNRRFNYRFSTEPVVYNRPGQ